LKICAGDKMRKRSDKGGALKLNIKVFNNLNLSEIHRARTALLPIRGKVVKKMQDGTRPET